MQFQVPQFIEVEDKIFGPFTFKQFLYLAGGAGIAFVIYVYFPFFLAVIPMLAVVGLSVALAFFPYNNRPFIYLVESAAKYAAGRKLYLWDKSEPTVKPGATATGAQAGVPIPKLSQSKLSDLSWSLDIKEKIK